MSSPTPDSTDLTGRVSLVTGANTGIGRATALELARRGAKVLVACRSAEKTEPVIEAIRAESGNPNVHFVALDLGDLDSVRACADAVLAESEPLHIFIANAGLAGQRGLTKSGFELAFGVNHLGHALLIRLLLPRLRASAPSRVVIVSSRAHERVGRWQLDDVREPTRTRTGFPDYARSKLANVYFARELARRLEGTGVTVYALHPGVVASDIWRRVPSPLRWLIKCFMVTVEEGALTQLHCATAPELSQETGLYYDRCAQAPISALAKDEANTKDLWRRTAEWINLPESLD